jgi:methylamine dehydrogenase light chain
MSRFDRALERAARRAARRISRRSFLSRLGMALVGGAVLPLLPVLRARADAPADDPASCDYWRHCAIDGFLCSCCGGSQTTCPPGTQMAPVTWIGTCRNPADGKDYVISYNDCCGKDFCGRCICNRNEGDKPAYITPRANDINWCVAAESTVYNCSTAIVLGVATARPNEGGE